MNSIIQKPWGTYQVLDQNKNYLTKKIIVKPNGKLSLQSHNHRSEHWMITQGKHEITINKKKFFKRLKKLHVPDEEIFQKKIVVHEKQKDEAIPKYIIAYPRLFKCHILEDNGSLYILTISLFISLYIFLLVA